jgi:hypothetical protein
VTMGYKFEPLKSATYLEEAGRCVLIASIQTPHLKFFIQTRILLRVNSSFINNKSRK